MSELTNVFEDKIMAAAKAISARDAMERKYSNALNGTNHMVRWDVKGAEPGQKSYDGFNVGADVVKDLIDAQYKETLRAYSQVADEAVSELLGACQPC